MKRRRYLTAGEWALWQQFTKEAVPLTPSPKNRPPEGESPLPSPQTPTTSAPDRIGPSKEAARPIVADQSRKANFADNLPYLPAGELIAMDRRQALRLKRGQYPIDASLDLHGMTQEIAHRAFFRFVEAAARRGDRCLLVITGKGSGRSADGHRQEGVLRKALPGWINASALRSHILAFHHAKLRDGGTGAYYILLRRNRIV